MTLEEQLKLAEQGYSPMLDDDGRVTGWVSPVRYFDKEDLLLAGMKFVTDGLPMYSPIADDNGEVIGW